ncbi:hypothetical protein TWF106_006286 [Orbilia oligospora]|uniref:Uncharacterized protein n=1 Tax=Orbilia oligospora TaxID=2813651 RepID=A0A6G1M9B6_ORBOL|nr:hypothetical protein TWF106_006286 [Orbilia oligospora]KAF3250247.1 hypothetical protein TWF192_005268 [Orbilia oligospora]
MADPKDSEPEPEYPTCTHTTTTTTLPPTTSDIFRIPEILAHILSHVPAVQLITGARLVCRAWKDEIETDPILRWRCWVPSRPKNVPSTPTPAESTKSENSGGGGGNSDVLKSDEVVNSDEPQQLQHQQQQQQQQQQAPTAPKRLRVLDGISLPPPSIRSQYTNAACKCHSSTSSPACTTHTYTDLFEVHPVAIHFLQLFWRRFMRLPLSKAQAITATDSRDALMDELVALIKPKLKEFETAVLVEPPSGIRLNTSNRLIRPENLSSVVSLYCGVQYESLIETKLYDNGTTTAPFCQSSRTSRRRMLSVKDLVYNVMHRSLFGDIDLNEVRKRREPTTNKDSYFPEHYSVIMQIEGKEDKGSNAYGGMQDTEVEITLALYEPYDIIDVETRKISESTAAVKARSIPRYSSSLEPRSWNKPFVPRKTPWRVWARDKRPKKSEQLPDYSTVYDYYQENRAQNVLLPLGVGT